MAHSTVITYNDTAEQVFDATKILEATGFKLINTPPYASDSPTVISGAFYQISNLTSFAASITEPAGTSITFALMIDGIKYFWNSTAATWAVADGTTSQSNTAAVINTNAAALKTDLDFLGLKNLQIVAFLNSDGTDTPTLTSVTIGHEADTNVGNSISECNISATIKDILGDLVTDTATFVATLIIQNEVAFKHGNNLIFPFTKTKAFDSSGNVSLSVIETETPGQKLQYSVIFQENNRTRTIRFNPAVVPDLASSNLLSITVPLSFDFG